MGTHSDNRPAHDAVGDAADWFERVAPAQGSRVFLATAAGRSISYLELCRQTAQWAQLLAALGVQPGARVAVRVEKSPEAVLLYLACLRLGAVYVPINTANSLNEVEYLLSDSQPCVAVVAPGERESLAPVAARACSTQLETLGAQGEGSLPQRLPATTGAFTAARHAPEAPAALVYTSGTTGRAKGAILTRGNLASNAAALVQAWHFSSQDVLLHALPLFHVHGLFTAINTALAAGATLLLLPKFEAATVVAQLRAATVFMGVPTHYTRLLQEPGLERAATAHMRLFVSGSAPLLAETHHEFLRRTGHAILERYGMTETLMNTSNPYDGPRRPGSVGPPLPGVALRVADPDGGAPLLEVDTVGALEVRGPNVFAGYWRDNAKTREAFTADGWFRTGDLGRVDRDGYVHIVGRAKDLVISGGYNVYPKEVESELDALPGVAESAVFGVAHPDFGEGVTAAVVAQPGARLSEAALLETLRPRLASYKVPKRIVLVEELPRNAMGKVQKNALRATYAGLYQEV
ncbi:MAG TPA: AMP-binding protein [Candidatus Dormibacteraeota bacterium]|nr:AMP-binding protein [Candidatus Dormibacteraeota bacterium]